jgi:hypothetical protein
VNRALKEFGTEELPFKRFLPNAAFYYSIVLSFFLYESFKRDVANGIIDGKSYPTTFRRILIDNANKDYSYREKDYPQSLSIHL